MRERDELNDALSYVRDGDVQVITRLDRLERQREGIARATAAGVYKGRCAPTAALSVAESSSHRNAEVHSPGWSRNVRPERLNPIR